MLTISAPAHLRIAKDLSFDNTEDDDDTINVVCPATTDGNAVFIPYPYDCNLYYMCEGFKPTLMSCPGQLEFDATLNVCNWAFAAGCVATPRPTPPEITTEDGFQGTTEEVNQSIQTVHLVSSCTNFKLNNSFWEVESAGEYQLRRKANVAARVQKKSCPGVDPRIPPPHALSIFSLDNNRNDNHDFTSCSRPSPLLSH